MVEIFPSLAMDGAIKDREPGVAFKIAAAADAVHQIHPGYVRRVGVTVDIKLQPHVEGDNPRRRIISG